MVPSRRMFRLLYPVGHAAFGAVAMGALLGGTVQEEQRLTAAIGGAFIGGIGVFVLGCLAVLAECRAAVRDSEESSAE